MGRTVWLVDAFTNELFGGNVAGVVPVAVGLTAGQMQRIAAELAASETAFVLPPTNPDTADLRIRFFTPTAEVDLCGHATIGSICGLAADGRLLASQATGVCRLETEVGVLPISFRSDGVATWAEMRQAPPQFRDAQVDVDELLACLGMRSSDLDEGLPQGLAFTGLWDLFVPVKSLAIMAALQPNLNRMATWNSSLGVVSTHVYCAATVDPANHYHARDFSPVLGIPEDPATGTATGALAALLHRHGQLAFGTRTRFEQGFEIGRPSLITAYVDHDTERKQDAVYVGGQAVVSLRGELSLA